MPSIEEIILQTDCLKELERIQDLCQDRKIVLGIQALNQGCLTDDCLCSDCTASKCDHPVTEFGCCVGCGAELPPKVNPDDPDYISF